MADDAAPMTPAERVRQARTEAATSVKTALCTGDTTDDDGEMACVYERLAALAEEAKPGGTKGAVALLRVADAPRDLTVVPSANKILQHLRSDPKEPAEGWKHDFPEDDNAASRALIGAAIDLLRSQADKENERVSQAAQETSEHGGRALFRSPSSLHDETPAPREPMGAKEKAAARYAQLGATLRMHGGLQWDPTLLPSRAAVELFDPYTLAAASPPMPQLSAVAKAGRQQEVGAVDQEACGLVRDQQRRQRCRRTPRPGQRRKQSCASHLEEHRHAVAANEAAHQAAGRASLHELRTLAAEQLRRHVGGGAARHVGGQLLGLLAADLGLRLDQQLLLLERHARRCEPASMSDSGNATVSASLLISSLQRECRAPPPLPRLIRARRNSQDECYTLQCLRS